MRSKVLFISWTPHNRATDIAAQLDGVAVTPASWARGWPWPIRFSAQAIATVWAVARRRPDHVIFTNPPFVSGAACLVGARLVGAKCWADSHSGAFNDPRWERLSHLNSWVLARCAGTIFHNHPLARLHHGASVRILVLTTGGMRDRAADRTPVASAAYDAVVVSSYSFDEPTPAVIEAAALVPDLSIAMTGNAPSAVRDSAPSNVHFTGHTSAEAYHSLLANAGVVVCLTERDHTMQNGATEALEHRRPVILSGTDALREWARDIPGVLTLAANTPEEIATAIRRVSRDQTQWNDAAGKGQQAALTLAELELTTLRQALFESSARS